MDKKHKKNFFNLLNTMLTNEVAELVICLSEKGLIKNFKIKNFPIPDEIIGSFFTEVFPEKEQAKFENAFINCVILSEIVSLTTEIHQNKNTRVYELHFIPIYTEGVILTITDKTNIKVLEKKFITNAIKIEERERNKLSHELHDNLGPVLATVKLYLEIIFESRKFSEMKFFAEKGLGNIRKAIEITREISHGLSPIILEQEGLKMAVLRFFNDLEVLYGLRFSFKTNISSRLPVILEITLYRIIMELITNAIKHSKAEKSFLKIQKSKNNKKVELFYWEENVTFTSKNTNNNAGIGLLNIKQKVERLFGEMSIQNNPNKGFKVIIVLPISEFNDKNNLRTL